MSNFSTSLLILTALCALLPEGLLAERSDIATKRLSSISEHEESIYQNLARDPDFYGFDDLDRHIRKLVDSYSSYLIDYPEDIEALILYGKLLRRLGEDDDAFAAFLKADQLDPRIAVVKQQIGTYLVEEDNALAALPFYLMAVELEPETPEYHFGLGQLLNEFGEIFIENELFTRDALEREMIKAFKRTTTLRPDDFGAQMRLGEAYYDLASPDWKSAMLHWNKLRKTADSQLTAEILDLHRARVMGKLGRKDEAKRLLDDVHSQSLQKSKGQVLTELSQI